MAATIITPEDLEQFKRELLKEIRLILSQDQISQKKWLRSAAVREMLNISPGTLQAMRTSGVLKYSKINGTMFYKLEDVVNMLETNKTK